MVVKTNPYLYCYLTDGYGSKFQHVSCELFVIQFMNINSEIEIKVNFVMCLLFSCTLYVLISAVWLLSTSCHADVLAYFWANNFN